jgi:hypothetical protein
MGTKYTYDFKDLILPKNQYRLLKRFEKSKLKYNEIYDDLIKLRFITFNDFFTDEIGCQIPIKDKCHITEKGLCYLQYYRSKFIDNRLPVVISLMSLTVSIVLLIEKLF